MSTTKVFGSQEWLKEEATSGKMATPTMLIFVGSSICNSIGSIGSSFIYIYSYIGKYGDKSAYMVTPKVKPKTRYKEVIHTIKS